MESQLTARIWTRTGSSRRRYGRDESARRFHERLPGYQPTRLIDASALADRLGLAGLWVKDESWRLGLPAFKILGASWAVYLAIGRRLGTPIGDWETVDGLRAIVEPLKPLSLVTATDGNHGRAVARLAMLLGLGAHVFVPANTIRSRIEAIEREGALVTLVDGTYDDAVITASRTENSTRMLVSDTSWPGYEDIPRWIIAGYGTMLLEVDDQLDAVGASPPDVVVAQAGVGAFLASVIQHFHQRTVNETPRIVSAEPLGAACILESLQAGRIVNVPGPHNSIMAGLNCGTPSLVAWPILKSGVDVAVAVGDPAARAGVRELSSIGISAGESGAAGLAGLMALIGAGVIGGEDRVLIFNTEGDTSAGSSDAQVATGYRANRAGGR